MKQQCVSKARSSWGLAVKAEDGDEDGGTVVAFKVSLVFAFSFFSFLFLEMKRTKLILCVTYIRMHACVCVCVDCAGYRNFTQGYETALRRIKLH